MGIINLSTNLKSVKFGKDRKNGGSSNQPYITTPIPNGVTLSSPDFLLRNGYLNPVSSLQDVSRLTQMFADIKSPNGLLFILKQNLLSRIAPQTQTSTGILNNGVYNPLSTISQAGIVSIGGHLNKQGNPFASTGADSNNNNLYSVKVKYSQDISNNRLSNLYNNLVAVRTGSISILEYPGGPGSKNGVGKTIIKRPSDEQRTGLNNVYSGSNYFNGKYVPKINPDSSKYLKTIFYNDTNKGVSGKYARLTNFDVINAYNPDGTLVGNYNFNVYEPAVEGNTWPKNSKLIYNNNTFTYNQENLISEENNVGKLNGSPKIQDFRAKLKAKLQSDKKEKATILGATPNSPDYNLKNIEVRNLLGDPGNSQGKNLSSYTNGSGKGPLDKINAVPIYRSLWVTTNDNLKNDLVKFRIAAIDNDDPRFKTFMHFRAFLNSFSDSYNAEWASVKYLGRGENFYNYTGFGRTLSLSWTVAAQSKEELIPMYKKLNYLASNLMPDYSKNGYMRGPLMQLTVGGYLYEQVGFITSLTYDIGEESTWEIGIDDKGDSDSTVKELPHVIKVQLSYTPIHDFVPAKQTLNFDQQLNGTVKDKDGNDVIVEQGFANGYGPERFIALSAGGDKTQNNYDTAKGYNVGGYSVV
jgi:hypothetical protein